ncbi:MAG: DUF3445 domain-containing protein [Thermomicrobia bacterium]|nr:DUF3445 domain-containing protein [Thermomicrobia bacterium]
MLKHLALEEGAYDLKMNVRQLAPDCIIDVDPASYARELALKDEILADNARYYYQALPGTEDMQWETIAILLPNMARFYPEYFTLTTDGDRWRWTNRLLDTETTFTLGDPATLPLPPLDWVGRQAQEDLCVMDGNDPGSPLVAGHLCFASGWCLDDKMGRSSPCHPVAHHAARHAGIQKPNAPRGDVARVPRCAHLGNGDRYGVRISSAGVPARSTKFRYASASQRQEKRSIPGCFSPSDVTWKP